MVFGERNLSLDFPVTIVAGIYTKSDDVSFVFFPKKLGQTRCNKKIRA